MGGNVYCGSSQKKGLDGESVPFAKRPKEANPHGRNAATSVPVIVARPSAKGLNRTTWPATVFYVDPQIFAAIAKGAVRKASGALINAAAGYFLALFWCPLFFSGKFAVASAALLVSAIALIPAAVRCGRFYVCVFIAAVPLWALEAFFLYVTVGFAVLN